MNAYVKVILVSCSNVMTGAIYAEFILEAMRENREFIWDYFSPESTGLPIWVLIGCFPVIGEPRMILLSEEGLEVVMSISDEPEMLSGNSDWLSTDTLNAVKKWIIKNKENLVSYWNGEYDTYAFCEVMGMLKAK